MIYFYSVFIFKSLHDIFLGKIKVTMAKKPTITPYENLIRNRDNSTNIDNKTEANHLQIEYEIVSS